MSNTICVKINNRTNYYTFRWTGDINNILQVWIKKEWVNVIRSTSKNIYGDRIFILESKGV
jgi:hypothetical protein